MLDGGARTYRTETLAGDDGRVPLAAMPATLAGERYVVKAAAPATERRLPVEAVARVACGVVAGPLALSLPSRGGALDVGRIDDNPCLSREFFRELAVRAAVRGVAVARLRVRASTPFAEDADEAERPRRSLATAGAGVVDLAGLPGGAVTVALQYVTADDLVCGVLQTTIVWDTGAPSPPTARPQRAAGAFDERFTPAGIVELV
ncbi:MAG: hypothetical protein FJ137_16515, partial [Deltaproteobacteria bacterium]|nr:hypothetical protein [Deltaproteobacteria bacterium]